MRLLKKHGNSSDATVEVIVPTLNEEKVIHEVLEGVKQHADRVLVIDGNSKDKTAEVARNHGVKVLKQNGRGKGSALREAFNEVESEIIVMIDADGSMKPKEVPAFINAMAPDVDLVKGSRFLNGAYSEDMTLVREIGNRLFTSLVNVLWDTEYTDLCYGFGAIRREALKKLLPHLKSTNFEIEAEIYIKAKKLGLNVVEIPSVELKRRHGKSNLKTIRDGFRIFRVILREFLRNHN